jgi:hypothetical protein
MCTWDQLCLLVVAVVMVIGLVSLLPLGNGPFGLATWAASHFVAQLPSGTTRPCAAETTNVSYRVFALSGNTSFGFQKPG